MIDIFKDQMISLDDAAKSLPNAPALSTLHRWRTNGVKGVKLETVAIGRQMFTSKEALQRFINATTAVMNDESRAEAVKL